MTKLDGWCENFRYGDKDTKNKERIQKSERGKRWGEKMAYLYWRVGFFSYCETTELKFYTAFACSSAKWAGTKHLMLPTCNILGMQI